MKDIYSLKTYVNNSMCLLKYSFNGNINYDNGLFLIDQKYNLPFNKGLIASYSNYLICKDYINFVYNEEEYQINIKDSQIFSNDSIYEDFRNNIGKRKIFLNKQLNYFFVEILETDKINLDQKKMFKINDFELFKEQEGILSPFYTTEGELFFSQGIIKHYLNDHLFSHTCFIDLGVTLAPLLDKIALNRIMGIYIGKIKDFNLGITMAEIMKDIKTKYYMGLNIQNNLEKNFATLYNHTDSVTNLILLDNYNLCSCSCDGNIIIYDLNTFKELCLIKDNEKIIFHTQLSNKNIVSCCENGDIKIYEKNNSLLKMFISDDYTLLDTLRINKKPVCKVIEINEDLIASCSLDGKINIWKNNNNKYNCIKSFSVNEEGQSINILKINEKEMVSSSSILNCIIFWNLNDFIVINKINNIVCNWNRNSLLKVNKNILLVGGDIYEDTYYGVYLIDIINHQLYSHFNNKLSITSAINLTNGHILVGCENENNEYLMIEYKLEGKYLIEQKIKKNPHDNLITSLIETRNGEIISSSLDGKIRFWI